MRADPTTGGTTTSATSMQFRERNRPAIHPEPEIAATQMREYGILISVDCSELNPKDLMTRFAKFWVPPLGI